MTFAPFAAALTIGLLAVSSVVTGAQVTISGPAPEGPPEAVATAAIRQTTHPCGAVIEATRLKNGTIRAVCSNGEAYRVMTMNGHVVTISCSFGEKKLGISGC